MDSLAFKVAHRFVMRDFTADAIANIPEVIHKFEQALARFSQHEADAQRVLEAQAYLATPAGQAHLGNPELQKAYQAFYSHHISNYILFPKFSFEILKRLEIPQLFLALLQQYEIPPALRRKVEAASKFQMRSRIQKPKKEVAVQVYLDLLNAYRGQLELAKDVLREGKLRGQSAPEGGEPSKTLKAGPFELVNTGGFNDEVMGKCATVVEHAAKLFHAKGLAKICYGEVLISNTLMKSSVYAFYLVQKDEMFVRANLKGKEQHALRIICHELGHRLEHKFLSNKKRDIEQLYYKMKNKQSDADREQRTKNLSEKPAPGDTVVSKGRTYVVDRLGYGRGFDMKIDLHREDDPTKKATVSLSGWLALKSGQSGTSGLDPKPSGFITSYAATSPGENFAEMLAFFVLGKLPDDQVAMLESVLG